jgi:CRISPR-associated protein Csb2
MLALDIEWLLGVCFSARSPADAMPDWPPQPDRVFSALTASWGARGARDDERATLEWLENLPSPELMVTPHSHGRTSVMAYVPPNDPALGDIRILPDRRRRQPRRFPATTLSAARGDPHLRLLWRADPTSDRLATLAALARDTSYIGHSSSLVRCAFSRDPPQTNGLRSCLVTSAPYAGRLLELETLHARHVQTGDAAARPLAATLIHARPVSAPFDRTSVFGRRWIVLAYDTGDRPDVRATASIGRAMRDALMSSWEGQLPEWLSGHAPNGSPSGNPHMSVVSLANAGHRWSDGSWLGLAIVLPRAAEEAWLGAATPEAFANQARFRAALRGLFVNGGEPGIVELRLGFHGRARLRLLEVPEQDKNSLRPSRYLGSRERWTTVTPIVLDRHPKGPDTRAEATAMIAESCVRIGLPRPEWILVHKHAAAAGAPSAWPAGGAPRWAGWARPGSLATRPLTHATLQWREAVEGPVILGAGRFFGLGLCLPSAEGGMA